LVGDKKRNLPEGLEVVVWTHHKEWGLTSNTGCLLGLTLENCTLLMKGLPEHDNQMEENLLGGDCLTVVLWPDNQSAANVDDSPSGASSDEPTISLDEIKAELLQKNRRVVLIAADGTWRNARRMVARLPRTVPRLDLSADIVFSSTTTSQTTNVRESILAPLRSRDPSVQDRQVCTAEAVVGALTMLGLSTIDGEHVLSMTRKKVDLIRRYRGKV
jgi:DTW domain-containing protein YfiP